MNNCERNNESATFKCDRFGTFTTNDVNCINPSIPPEGSIIPFASGLQFILIGNNFGNGTNNVAPIGFGSFVFPVTLIGNTINLNGIPNEAFTVPRDGNITAISASFTYLVGVVDLETATVRAQIFRAPVGSNSFTATSASVDLAPSITALSGIGQISFASANIPPVPVVGGDSLLMVFHVLETEVAIAGYASAGINIV
ncbi:exosporium glycoprotein BclB-related protein [Lysinibacillus sp. CTST325]